ncbi:hypothetical protein [Rhodonellum sp.]|uniref:hypothetical protein n=1 Tax=Rhodonellum sp. TaxID=2231180 RepID=UPI002725316F|nr:hypothetical protein [Rhodonellum sp.]MDO9552380.1 hypothetical protein [Rhodonellum sp.]
MCAKINSKYLESYVSEFTNTVCENYFRNKQYMSGQDIIQLTPSPQVNFFIIKALFEGWQLELEKLKSNPYFDYRDKAVHEALGEFMNVLSRNIKIDRNSFEPLLAEALAFTIFLAVDPLTYYTGEFEKVDSNRLNDFLKENKKYYKWHSILINNLIDKAGLGNTHEAYNAALLTNFEAKKNELESAESLLKSLDQITQLDYKALFVDIKEQSEQQIKAEKEEAQKSVQDFLAEANEAMDAKKEEIHVDSPAEIREEEIIIGSNVVVESPKHATGSRAIDPLQAWERFESEEYMIMKGTIGKLAESVSINQRFMFTKELFDGNPDLLKHTLKSIDNCDSFIDAINLLNLRFVEELNWDKDSEPVVEFLQLIFRKFDQKG